MDFKTHLYTPVPFMDGRIRCKECQGNDPERHATEIHENSFLRPFQAFVGKKIVTVTTSDIGDALEVLK